MAYMNLSYTHIISYTRYAVHSIIMYTMLNQEFTVSSRLHNNIPANIFPTQRTRPQRRGELVNAALLSLINEECVSVCSATLLVIILR